jgi:hypothetical protein
MIRALIAFSVATFVAATCDNACSGHGVCECGFCLCYDNWGMNFDLDTGDCSDRICPFEFAWVDTPDRSGAFHKYAECANRGICNRETGECECFEGYEGKACARTSCPNDCSGHGTCEYIESLGYENTPFDGSVNGKFVDDAVTFTTYQWDNYKTRGCVCDPEYGDIDCSKRMCPYGNDMMDRRPDLSQPLKYQVQNIWFIHEDDITKLESSTFALTFKSKLNETFTTTPIVFRSTDEGMSAFVAEITSALQTLPNRVIDRVEVHGMVYNDHEIHINVTFVGDYVQGQQNLLVVQDTQCGNGCTPKITGLNLKVMQQNITEAMEADFNSYECGRRGKCDYDTGLCQCFEGFTGASCNACTALI